ncbi:MAG: gliding motility-associated ABC transporter ATP-binding subunit GldA [Bacteroidetes bacterium]|nr:MAG: gliding motility-associated ABC transporter ATP-binding subunit GldA [Bacteroidota bacterium]MBL1144784.1 gliding motility-associated ABC transporter ATP-binding subunit GldA [Bacteroidota bacterium]NOG57578.1 gliding motility-associated ABC transporter ATP-binding subunit GldA [Bacteroidota bacterium]
MSIIVENVTKIYGKQKALNDVSFTAKPGEIVGFLGPNGAGKSTMMKIITGFLPANSGSVSVCGLEVSSNQIEIKKKIGYLAEQNPLYYDMYVREYLAFIAGIFKINDSKNKINEIIELVGLSLEQNKKIGALSKGYKQRVGLAHALLHDPEVLILDEPTTGLDPNQLEEIRNLIKKIGAKKTVMLSTHIMQEVEAICDRVIIINRGEIVANDSTKNLSSIFNQKSVIIVEFKKELSIKRIASIKGITKVEAIDSKSFKVYHNPEVEVRNELFNLAISENNSVETLHKETINLEGIFKELTSKN